MLGKSFDSIKLKLLRIILLGMLGEKFVKE